MSLTVLRPRHFTRLLKCTLPGLAVVLASCTSTVSNPIFLSPTLKLDGDKLTETTLPLSVKASLESYLEGTTPLFFFVANDGGHTLGWRCRNNYCDYDGMEEYQAAKERCESLRLGMGCSLLYLRKMPVTENIVYKPGLTSLQLDAGEMVAPDKSHGKIIYLPGYSGWSNREYNFPPAMSDADLSPVLWRLESYGWDVDVLNILHSDRSWLASDFDLYGNLLFRKISAARESGYQRVILYGGSRGGAEIMRAVLAGAQPDAIALMEPDWHGPKYDSRGEYNDDHSKRAQEIKKLLSEQKVERIVFSFFRNSRWYADFTREEIKDTLGILGNNYFLIAAPADLEGHGGSWTHRFSNLYAQCLHRFFLKEISSESECVVPELDNSKYQNWATNKWIKEGNYKSLAGVEILDFINNKALCPYSPASGYVSKYSCHIWDEEHRQISFMNEFDQLLLSKDILDLTPNGFCRHNGLSSPTYRCAEFFIIEHDLVAIVPQDKNSFYWYRLVDKEKVENTFSQAIYSCENKSKLESVNCHKL